jgi:large subunit ribosomal protein L4
MSPTSTASKSTASKTTAAKSSKSSKSTASKSTKSSSTGTVSVVSPDGAADATVELPAQVFSARVSLPLMHQVVVAQQAAARQGTHSVKTRGAVRGGGKKPYRQKGTGRARQGSNRAPQFTGGGVVHGPVPRSYVQRTPKKMKSAALRGALSDRAAHDRVHVVSSFTDGSDPKTKNALAVLLAATGTPLSPSSQALVVTGVGDNLARMSLRNVRNVNLLDSGQLNTYDVLVSDHVVFSQQGLAEFLARSGVDLPEGLLALLEADGALETGDPAGATAGSATAGAADDETDEPEDEQP